MWKSLLRRPSAALVLSSVALFMALGGGAYAAASSDSKQDKKIANSAAKAYFNLHIAGASVSDANFAKTAGSATNATNATNAINAINATNATTATTATTANSAPIAKVTYVTSAVSVPPSGAAVLVIATCPAGTTVIGGGGQIADETSGFLNDSYPSGKTEWSVDFVNDGASDVNGTATAICAPAAATAP
jgi:cytochrome bd-type quinol oxidase subunit 2